MHFCCCWVDEKKKKKKEKFRMLQTNNQLTAAASFSIAVRCFSLQCAYKYSTAALQCLSTIGFFASNCNNACLKQLPASLCDAPHCVSGTLNFITFGKIPFFAFALSCKKKTERERKGLSRSDVIRKQTRNGSQARVENFHFQTERECSKCSWCCVFNTWEIYFQEGSYLCFPMNSHHPSPFPSLLPPKQPT